MKCVALLIIHQVTQRQLQCKHKSFNQDPKKASEPHFPTAFCLSRSHVLDLPAIQSEILFLIFLITMKRKTKMTFTVFFLFISVFLRAQSAGSLTVSPDIHFNVLGAKEGLAYNTVLAIVKDHQGFLWIATPEGLSRYDGTSFITYKHNPHDSITVMSNHINDLAIDSNGMLWGSTSDGLFRFNPVSGVFTNYYPRPGNASSISCDNLGRLFIDSKDNVYVGSWMDYNVFDKTTGLFHQYAHDENDSSSIRETRVGYTYEDRNGKIWVGTYSGLDLLDPKTNSFTHIQLPSFFEQFGRGPLINDMYADANGNLWLSTWGSGIIRYSTATGESKIYRIEKDRPKNGSTNVATRIMHTDYPGEENKLWIATKSSGLYLFDMEEETFTNFKETVFGDPAFVTADINTLYDDGVGNIFIGTGKGLLHYSRSKLFNTVSLTLNPLECLTDIFTVYQDPADSSGNTLWIGTWTCGGYRYNMQNGTLQREAISFSADPLIKYSAVYNFYRDKKRNLWAFCRDGTYILKHNTTTWQRLPADDADPQKMWKSTIASFEEKNDGTFWFGSRKGLMHFDPLTEKVRRVPIVNEKDKIEFRSTMQFVEFPENIFWIVGAMGMMVKYNAVNNNTTIYKHGFQDTSSFPVIYDIREIFLDHRKQLWLGSKHGLITFNPLDAIPVYKSYHTTDGLPSESIYSITEDKQGNIWCATQNGITRFDPQTSSCRNYGVTDGLLEADLPTAFNMSPYGNIFIGLPNSIQYFDPLRAGKSDYCGPIRITGVKVLGKDYLSAQTPSYTDSIKLTYKQNEVTISFAMINYSDGNHTTYDYYLEGLNIDWVPLGKNHSVSFTNLDGGTYYLRVRGYNADGVCDNGERLLTLIVTPPFWKTNWFYILVFLLTAGSVYAYNRIRLYNLRQQKKLLVATVEKRTTQLQFEKNRAEKSEKFKQQFLANMSHEIRTPMNAVVGMTNLLIDKNPRADQHYYLNAVKNSAETLLHIINDILDLSKIEAGKVELENIDFALNDVIAGVMQVLQHKADEKGIRLITEIDKEMPVLAGDPVRLYQVLMNLGGNALKFTEKGSVRIIAKITSKSESQVTVSFSVIDTGIGIPKDKLKQVFESFSQAHSSDTRRYGGTGLGLTISKQLIELFGGNINIESEEGVGTSFSFKINFTEGSAMKLQQNTDLQKDIDGSILNGLKILIADDNEYNRIVAADTLKLKANVTITHASTGKEVIAHLRGKDFDVILMDVHMPEMNGFEATKQIREKFPASKNDIPIIALTAGVLRDDLEQCRQAGMNGYLTKPFTASQLISGIAEVLGIEIKMIARKQINEESPKNNHAVTDLRYLQSFCEGDMDRIKKYINIFIKSAPTFVETIRSAVDEKNYAEISDRVHNFKSMWIMMGMTQSEELALKIEQQGREENGHNFIENTLTLLSQIEQAVKELEHFQNQNTIPH